MAGWESKTSVFATKSYNESINLLEKNQDFIKRRQEAIDVSKQPIDATSVLDSNSDELKSAQDILKNNDTFKIRRKGGKTNEELAAGIEGVSGSDVGKVLKQESDRDYTAYNKGSGAYGAFQFKPMVAYEFAKQMGYKGEAPTSKDVMPDELKEFMTTENQDEMFIRLSNRNTGAINSSGAKLNAFSFYMTHQQGATGGTKILSAVAKGKVKELPKEQYDNMVYNLGLKDEDEEILLSMYSNKDMVEGVTEAWINKYKKAMG